MNIIYTKAGKEISIILETSYDGYRQNSPSLPIINNIYTPNLSLISGFPQDMKNIGPGIYVFNYLVPVYLDYVGDLIVDIEYLEPITNIYKKALYQVIVQPIFGLSGNFHATPGN